MSTVLSASAVPENEITALQDLQESLPETSTLGNALRELATGILSGSGVTVTRNDEQISPAKAASIIGISRTHLYKILDAGLIPYNIVGERDRRMNMADVITFKNETSRFRAADAVSVAKRDQLEDDIFDSME